MKKTIILYFILSFLIACKNEDKVNTILDNTNLVSSEKVFTIEELEGKTYEQLHILRNEIFARKGYVFKDETLNAYFEKKEWYKPDKDVEIVLDTIEKTNIELIKSIEEKLKPFELPYGYEKTTSNLPKQYNLSVDLDGDNIKDVIQVASNTSSYEKVLFIYLTANSKTYKIVLDEGGEYEIPPNEVKLENNIIVFSFYLGGSTSYREFKLKFNSKIKELQLTAYASADRAYPGHISKKYDLISGTYEVTKEINPIYDPSKIIKTKNKGTQQTKLITPNLINDKLYSYLENIGDEFGEDKYPDYNYGEFRDCREAIIEKIALEFEYGIPNYLGGYSIFKKELKDFVQNINIDELMKSQDDTYSKTYKLHRNWDLDYIKNDDCEDEFFLIFDVDTNTFRIQINNCSLVYEDGEVIHASEQSIMFEYVIEANCSYKFERINGAG
ncbi:YARHG domain-containing protein [Cellulophaga baltica]|uniref:YARHG domain-containing protein n=1 Tax=Cellulophaga baltica TaxID=76594 RepID=A0A1G7EP30_9FLAO|nr:YARHG domain-containing protein [Cellulophaga baltica]SDE65367.1 YARHG domain-containing protein [Cellulophaga baltica]